MQDLCKETRENIELKLTLSVVLGDLDEGFANLWIDAVRSLNDRDMSLLIKQAAGLNGRHASSLTLRFLMQHHYPFREMVLYHTDDDFKKKMGLNESH